MLNNNRTSDETQVQLVPAKRDDGNSAAGLSHNKRPGVSNTTLLENGIEPTSPAGGAITGFQIPFYTYDASPKGRVPVFDEAFPDSNGTKIRRV